MIFIIVEMSEECCDELCYSKHYYKKAKMLRTEHMEVSRKYLSLAKQELEHAYTLNTLAESLYHGLEPEEKEKIREMYEKKEEEIVCKYDELSYSISKMSF